VTERLGSWMTSSDLGIEFKILETFAAGPMVMNRRIDSFKSKTRPLTWEGIGVFFVKDGKIKEWSDYTIRVTSDAQFKMQKQNATVSAGAFFARAVIVCILHLHLNY
jgi:limonene-1,2-epoxide hydrolase